MEECSNRKQYRLWSDLCKGGGEGMLFPIMFMNLNSMKLVDQRILEDNNLAITFKKSASLSVVKPYADAHKAKE